MSSRVLKIFGLGLAAVLMLLSLSACARKVKVRAIKAVKTTVESSVTTTTSGTVTAQQQAILAFGTSGRVHSVNVDAGAKVKRGDLLAELENQDLKTVYQDAEREMKRAKQLYSAKLVSRTALDESKKGFEIAKANLEKTIIRAPFDGIITDQNLELGELAQATPSAKNPPLQIVDFKPRLVKGDIDEVDLARVKEGLQARIKVQAVRPEPFTALVQRVVPYVSTVKEQDRTSRIELAINEDHAGLIPVGASAEVEIITEQKPEVVGLPARAVLGHGDSRYIFKVVNNKLQRVSVKIGIGNYAKIEVASGLQAGEAVAMPPEDVELRDGMAVDAEITKWP